MMDGTRVRVLNEGEVRGGKYVLYWMQQSQRTRFNHALEYAIGEGDRLGLPVVVCFGLMDDYPEANERHYAFMLEGLRDVKGNLESRGVKFVAKRGGPAGVALHYAKDAALVVCDRGYLRHQKRWRDEVADGAGCRVVEVESDVVVPVEAASEKREFAARTIRPKIQRLLKGYLVPVDGARPRRSSVGMKIRGDVDASDVEGALAKLKVDRGVKRVSAFRGGEEEARRMLAEFVAGCLSGYDEGRNEPAAGGTSRLSAYLHFGQISPLEIALAVLGSKAPKPDREAFVEELVVRRELAANFVHYAADYDRYSSLPEWARKTLSEHRRDRRAVVYSRKDLEAAKTHDRYWNAAQTEMNRTGFMHNYMRMYWGKKILEWSATPEEGFENTLYLNNKLFLCGRDANAYANVGWVYGLHDRPWGERPIFGKVRYMNAEGLRRKFDMEAYVRKVEAVQ